MIYGGVFFLGFGGSRWTSDIAISYYKHILATGAELMVIPLLIRIAAFGLAIVEEKFRVLRGSLIFRRRSYR